nr:immunoglobulin heavy chain junction region [Macaca mulatta]
CAGRASATYYYFRSDYW